MVEMNLFTKHKQKITEIEEKLIATKGRGINLDKLGINRYKLLYIK